MGLWRRGRELRGWQVAAARNRVCGVGSWGVAGGFDRTGCALIRNRARKRLMLKMVLSGQGMGPEVR